MRRRIALTMVALLALLIYTVPVAAEERQIEDEIFYEVIVDRYNNGDYSNDEEVDVEDPKAYHGGDLEGITNRLDDNVQTGVTTLVLSPIMANSDKGFHGYWIEDFKAIEPEFGTLEDLETLIAEAHERDINIVLEFVTNYVSENHPIATDPERVDWILTEDVSGPDWTEGVVQLDQDHPEVQEFLLDAALYWLNETDIDGLQLHAVDQSSLDFLESFTSELKKQHPDAYLLGDVLDDTAEIGPIMENTALDAIDNYAISQAIAEILSKPDQSPAGIYEAIEDAGDYQSLVFVDDKYSKRFTQRFAENGRNTLTAWKLALTFMYTAPVNPVLLQGSEVGMYGETAEDSQRLVPFTGVDQELTEFHERISSLRAEFPALRYGDYELVDTSDSFAVFKRTHEDQTLYIGINNGSESSYIDISGIDTEKMFRGFLEDNLVRENDEDIFRVGIPRESVEVYQLMDDPGFNWTLIIMVAGILAAFVGIIIMLERKQKQREREEASGSVGK